MFDHVLVPLDGTTESEIVLPHLHRLVRAGAREVTLVRADLPVGMEAYPLLCDAALNQARRYLAGVRDRLAEHRIHCRILARIGAAAPTILEAASERGASLILLATRPKSAVARVLFGSVSEHVLRESPIPVLAVPPPWSYDLAPELPTELRPVRKILVPLERDDLSLRILPQAIEMAQAFEATLHLLHVEAVSGAGRREEAEEDTPTAGFAPPMEQRLQEAWLRCAAAGIETHQRIERGEVVPVILDVCRKEKMDWIAMATHARTGLARWMTGSFTERVLRESGIPLLIVNKAAELHSRTPRRLSLSGRG